MPIHMQMLSSLYTNLLLIFLVFKNDCFKIVGSLLNLKKTISATANFECLWCSSWTQKVLFLEVVAEQLLKNKRWLFWEFGWTYQGHIL